MRKPFYSKTKLLYQTKINLWGYDEFHLKQKLKKKKWEFLKFKNRGNPEKKVLDTFRFSPFSRNSSTGRLKNNFKNNLYFRKLVRLKYGRLKNKEFYNIFRKYKGYKKLISRLGSRLDTNLFLLLSPTSIFKLRQDILHGKVLLNGRKIKSPNIELKLFDVVSLKLDLFSGVNFLYQDTQEQVDYYTYLASRLFFLSEFHTLNKDVKSNFIKELSVLLGKGSYDDALNEFFTEEFNFLISENSRRVLPTGVKNVDSFDLQSILNILNKKYINQKILSFINDRKNNLSVGNIDAFLKNNSINDSKKGLDTLGFFNNQFNPENFEIKFNGNFLDVVFLGVSEKNISSENRDQFLLHYLY